MVKQSRREWMRLYSQELRKDPAFREHWNAWRREYQRKRRAAQNEAQRQAERGKEREARRLKREAARPQLPADWRR